MGEKEYEMIAEQFKAQLLKCADVGEEFALSELATKLCIEFKLDDERFDSQVFMKACGFNKTETINIPVSIPKTIAYQNGERQ